MEKGNANTVWTSLSEAFRAQKVELDSGRGLFPKLEEENIEVTSKAEKWHSGRWLSAGLGTAGLMAGLGDLKGLVQPE